MFNLAVWCLSTEQVTRAQQLAQTLVVEYFQQEQQPVGFRFILKFDMDGLSLVQEDERFSALQVDFVKGSTRHRRLYGGGKGQMIAKAVGVADKQGLHVVDATAGLGRDAFVLASLGCRVTLLERSGVVKALLDDGIRRAQSDETVRDIVSRMEVVEISAHDWLAQSLPVDVVFLDPMFPESKKTALSKKEMQIFQELIGADEDAGALLPLAIHAARFRVVVKRPRLASALASQPPTYTLTGKSNRFDVYVVRSMKNNA